MIMFMNLCDSCAFFSSICHCHWWRWWRWKDVSTHTVDPMLSRQHPLQLNVCSLHRLVTSTRFRWPGTSLCTFIYSLSRCHCGIARIECMGEVHPFLSLLAIHLLLLEVDKRKEKKNTEIHLAYNSKNEHVHYTLESCTLFSFRSLAFYIICSFSFSIHCTC